MFSCPQLKDLTPQVCHAAKLVLIYPQVETHATHLQNMKSEWKGKVDKLTELVDSATDPAQFVMACGEFPGVIPYVSYIGMCRTLGYGFRAVWSEIGYGFCLFSLK